MIINCLTLFLEAFEGFLSSGLIKKAVESGVIEINLINIRDFSADKHHRVDDYPYGGGPGMLLAPQPIFDCFTHLKNKFADKKNFNIYMSPGGILLNQKIAIKCANDFDILNILCGHYEGVDQRVIDECIDMEISIGDYVLSGGELPAMVLMDAIMRLTPGFMSNEDSYKNDSFFQENILEYPQYTRPKNFRGIEVPDVLLTGNHAEILKWRRQMAMKKTMLVRPDLVCNISNEATDKMADA